VIAGPPLILVGIDTPIGLALVRELGRAGIEVHGIARERRGLGLHSRWLAKGYIRTSEADTIPLIRRIARRSGARFVMTVSMSDALTVREAADAGQLPGLKPLLPSLDKLHLVNDKAAIAAIAERLGIAVPRTWQPSVDDLEAELPDLSYPTVLKWRDPETALPMLARPGWSCSRLNMRATPQPCARRSSATVRPASCRWCRPMCRARAGPDVPDEGRRRGAAISAPAAARMAAGRRCLHAVRERRAGRECRAYGRVRSAAARDRLGGPAMVEYRFDAATGRAVLMEINGRFWGSLPLASAAGAPFGLATYTALGLGRPLPPLPPYRVGLRARMMVPETRRLLRVLFAQRRIPDRTLRFSRVREAGTYLRGFADRTRHYVWSWHDPAPFVIDTLFVLRRAGEQVLGKLPGKSRRKRSADAGQVVA
jgi:predicted ATP-grasp superfamily ATP-dependent carboligase